MSGVRRDSGREGCRSGREERVGRLGKGKENYVSLI